MIRLLIIFLAAIVVACYPTSQKQDKHANRIWSLEEIADDVWVHKSYRNIETYGLLLSQGLVVKAGTEVLMVDTAWDDDDTQGIINLIKTEIGTVPKVAVITHAHDDKMGGVDALNDNGIDSIALDLSNEDAPKRGLTKTRRSFTSPFKKAVLMQHAGTRDGTLTEGPKVEVFYPGPGHTRDNIVVYVPKAKVLFGGCLIRPGSATSLGNTNDADLTHWAEAVRAVAAEFPDAEIVVPSHGPAGDRTLLTHTIALAEAAND